MERAKNRQEQKMDRSIGALGRRVKGMDQQGKGPSDHGGKIEEAGGDL